MMHCGGELTNGKYFTWKNEQNDLRYHPSDSRLVYSQHQLLFTGNHRHKIPKEVVITVHDISVKDCACDCKLGCDPHK